MRELHGVLRISMAMSATDLNAQLDYAPIAPLRRRRRIRRVVSIVLLIVMAGLTLHWGPTVWLRTKLLYHQRQCLRYTAAPDQVVFDSEPSRVALLGSDPNFVISGGCAFRIPSAHWKTLKPGVSVGPRGPAEAMIFLHELHVGGISRIVEVDRIAGANHSPYFIDSYDVQTHSVSPATFTNPKVVEQVFPSALSVLDNVGAKPDIRIYAGQIDPADGSHFTVRYEFRGKKRLANGYLRKDGRIELQRDAD